MANTVGVKKFKGKKKLITKKNKMSDGLNKIKETLSTRKKRLILNVFNSIIL